VERRLHLRLELQLPGGGPRDPDRLPGDGFKAPPPVPPSRLLPGRVPAAADVEGALLDEVGGRRLLRDGGDAELLGPAALDLLRGRPEPLGADHGGLGPRPGGGAPHRRQLSTANEDDPRGP